MFRRVAIPVLLAAVLAFVPATGSGASSDVGPEAVSADKQGWWNSLQGIESGTPAAPISGVYPGFPQQATGAPAGNIAAGLRLGQVDKVAAVGIVVDAPTGATVEEFTLTLTESAEPGANNSSAAVAKINACPITAFWVGEENARFNGRPPGDCTLLAIPGQRGAGGKWKFDLKSYGQRLLATGSSLGQNGLLLLPQGGPPETFQVTWAGIRSQTPPVFTFRATGGQTDDSDAFGSGSDFGGSFDTGSGFTSGSDDFGAVTFGDDFRSDFAQAPAPDAAPAAEPGVAPAPAAEAQSTPASLGEELGNIAGNLPPFALLGLLGLIAVFAVVGLALSRPPSTPEALTRRGGVSRALAARRTARRPLETA
jgi:hypothetical protein